MSSLITEYFLNNVEKLTLKHAQGLVVQLCLTLCNPIDCIRQASPSTLSTAFPRHGYWNGLPFPSPRNIPDPGIEPESPVSPALQEDSLPAEPLGKPIISGSLQRIFPTQGSNLDLLYYRQVLYCLSHQLFLKHAQREF